MWSTYSIWRCTSSPIILCTHSECKGDIITFSIQVPIEVDYPTLTVNGKLICKEVVSSVKYFIRGDATKVHIGHTHNTLNKSTSLRMLANYIRCRLTTACTNLVELCGQLFNLLLLKWLKRLHRDANMVTYTNLLNFHSWCCKQCGHCRHSQRQWQRWLPAVSCSWCAPPHHAQWDPSAGWLGCCHWCLSHAQSPKMNISHHYFTANSL